MKFIALQVMVVIIWGFGSQSNISARTDPIKVRLILNQESYEPGDRFAATIIEENNTDYRVDYERYIILDVYQNYYFYPRWTQDYDYVESSLMGNHWLSLQFFNFTWPSGAGTADGIIIWAAMNKTGYRFAILSSTYVVFEYYEPGTPTPTAYTPTPTPFTKPTTTPTPDHHEYTVTIPGATFEVDTGISLRSGDEVSINAYGTVCFHASICNDTTVGPNGYPAPCMEPECYEAPYNAPNDHAALIARIETVPYFFVGERCYFTVTQDGTLLLAINDADVSDNDGAFTALIQVYP